MAETCNVKNAPSTVCNRKLECGACRIALTRIAEIGNSNKFDSYGSENINEMHISTRAKVLLSIFKGEERSNI